MELLVQSTIGNLIVAIVLASLVLSVTRIWRNPYVAHALWLIVLVKLITPPLLLVDLPVWQDGDKIQHPRDDKVVVSKKSTATPPTVGLSPESTVSHSVAVNSRPSTIGYVASRADSEQSRSTIDFVKINPIAVICTVWLIGSMFFCQFHLPQVVQVSPTYSKSVSSFALDLRARRFNF